MQPLYDAPMLTIFTARRRATSGATSGCRRGFHRVALGADRGCCRDDVHARPNPGERGHAVATLTVVGTSDVQDSGLIPLLIKPSI